VAERVMRMRLHISRAKCSLRRWSKLTFPRE
jgi:hypothetical protein